MGVNITAIIPARMGSKRLPGKNIKYLDGRPLIAYSVLTALSIPSVNQVVVASDSSMILGETVGSGLDRIVLPPKLTTDDAPLTETLKHAVEYTLDKSDWVVLLQPTCPLRLTSLCERWIQQVLDDTNATGLLTVDDDGYKLGSIAQTYFNPHYEPMTPKANALHMMRENGVFYMFKTENVLKGDPWGYTCMPDEHGMLVNESKMIPTICPPEQSLANIDTQFDWDITEFLYHKYNYKGMFDKLEKELNTP